MPDFAPHITMTDHAPPQHERARPPVELVATLHKIIFNRRDGAYSVAIFVGKDGQASFTGTGYLAGFNVGHTVKLSGDWYDSPKYGKQLRIQDIEPFVSNDPDDIRDELVERLNGVGYKIATLIVDNFGEGTREVLNERPEQLIHIKGIGPKLCARIQEHWAATGGAEAQRRRQLIRFLNQHHIGPAFHKTIIDTYGGSTREIILKNPYQLIRDIDGIGFKTADLIAQSVDIADDHPARIEGAIEHILVQAEESRGHCYVHHDALFDHARRLIHVDDQLVADALGRLVDAGIIRHELIGEQQLALYRRHVWHTENAVAQSLARLAAAPEPDDLTRATALQLIDRTEAAQRVTLADAQRRAVVLGLTRRLLVVTGGPGTGKTTLVRILVAACHDLGETVHLAAPTGRAARRLAHATGHDASTIHRLLEYSFHQGGFQRDGGNVLDDGIYVIDEASMIDIYLMRALLDALPDDARLVLVGDVDQLPSVGPGTVLRDLIDSDCMPVVRLSEIFRQAAASWIVRNAHRINHGEMPLIPTGDDARSADWFMLRERNHARLEDLICDLVCRRLPSAYDFNPWTDIQVLCPMRVRGIGANVFNERLQRELNPNGQPVGGGQLPIRLGDRVMQLRNNYDKDVYNGDVGRVSQWDASKKAATVHFEDGREVTYTREDLDELTLAYASTVHKAQGSEYTAVIVPLVRQHGRMLQRNLVYTALTRARQLAIFVGDPGALKIAIDNVRPSDRNTRLQARLRDAVMAIGGTVGQAEGV